MTHVGIGYQSLKGLHAGKISLELPTAVYIFFLHAMKGKGINGKALTTLLRH